MVAIVTVSLAHFTYSCQYPFYGLNKGKKLTRLLNRVIISEENGPLTRALKPNGGKMIEVLLAKGEDSQLVSIRLPKSLVEDLRRAAQRAGISLDTHVTTKLKTPLEDLLKPNANK